MNNVHVLDVIGNEWSGEITQAIENVMNKLREIPKMEKHLPHLDSVMVVRNYHDEGNEQYTLGSYTRNGIIRICANKIKTVQQAIYVLLHEFAHHVAHRTSGIDMDYDSVKMNKAYLKEEMRADALAIVLMKKYFNADNALVKIIKEAKARLDYMYKKFMGKATGWGYDYTFTINWANTWEGWNGINPQKGFSTLPLAA